MKELIDALDFTHRTDTTLTNIISNAMQDCQYSPFADDIRKKIAILMKYHAQYGHLTVAQIRALGTTSQ